MDVDAFPEIQNFQHLPRSVIVKGGGTSFDAANGAELSGIVINNIGQAIRNIRVHVVIFDERKIPLLNTSVPAEPEMMPQGGVASFRFQFKELFHEIKDYHLFTNWSFDESA
ncbi:MAG: hypothetical protein EXS63_08430 [Candidatus Omnitrophica bacterium]|nr:hypothetical protein [Candidatus Omnitrophota bacterium]